MDLTLPARPFADREGMAALIAALGAGDARLVGGCVRDTLLGLAAADIDVATKHEPERTLALLRAAEIRAVPTGLAHGTVTAVLPFGPVEVTTLRRDVSTDGRHAVVRFAQDWRDDAARRDFTINALYADPVTGEVFDWHGGLADLAARRIRFIGDPLQRIAEDHLRILRFFRFHARFGDAVDDEGLDACTARANDLMALSRERIAAELLKLLVARDAVAVVRLMVERRILAAVLPEIDAAGAGRLTTLAAREAAAGIAPDAIRRLAALAPADVAAAVGARLKLSNVQRKRLEAANGGVGDEGPLGLAYRVGAAGAVDRLLLAGGDPGALADWHPPRLPIGGGELVVLGLIRGPAVAAALREVERRWIAEGFPGIDRVRTIASEVVGQAKGGASAISDQASSASSGRA